ncbi:amidohydrolase family protein [Streptomyces sp. NPDC048551]|uniref:amidohydrolase family protein n=1 Tax=Streptomyces sp. NPDC048551 TaxID=3155758 RepID=UPI003421ADCF
MSRSSALAVLLAAGAVCAAAALGPASAPAAAPSAGRGPGVVLSGTVVTMDDAGHVWPGARLWIRSGRIEAVAEAGRPLPAGARSARVVETGGVIYPGMIDLHNHPGHSVYPLMPVREAYADRYAWRYYDDEQDRRITRSAFVLGDPGFYDLGTEMSRYGEYKALAGGTTSVQGADPALPSSAPGCLVRNVETSRVGPRRAVSRVDLGRDAPEWAELARAGRSGVLILHLAEGTGPRMSQEYEAVRRSGLVGPRFVAVHGVALTPDQLADMARRGASLVWSPLSNLLLYGRTADVAAAKAAGLGISLGADWAPSGSKSVLGELKVADLVNRHALKGLFSDRELVETVTRNPARAMGWERRAGRIAPGYVSDLVVVDDRGGDPYRNLIGATEENVRLVSVGGEMLYGDGPLMARARPGAGTEAAARFASGRTKVIATDCPGTALPPMSLAETRDRLQRALDMDPRFLLERVRAKPASVERIRAELSSCPGGAPAGALTPQDVARVLRCRLGLPFERTPLSPLTTAEDPDWTARLLANPNLPPYLRELPGYYGER